IGLRLKSDNDLSCVLKVSIGTQSILITGDLGQKGERLLIDRFNDNVSNRIQADLLIAGHHGSQSSTSQAWLTAVNPSKVIFSAGYLNRYHFPSKKVIKRLDKQAQSQAYLSNTAPYKAPIQWWNTACSGQLTFSVSRQQVKLTDEARKSQRKWYHHLCLPSQKGHLFQ
ncbi:MAG: hypothetical protein GXO35_09230, partial [Gammaproteobacteria bacterium]|nr:hypothetical protein [Gammaproteobacteria bacterium]